MTKTAALSGLLLQTKGIMFASDKIFTVMIVILIIWAGILLMLFLTGRRVKKLEKEVAALNQGTSKRST